MARGSGAEGPGCVDFRPPLRLAEPPVALPAGRPKVYVVWHKLSDLRLHDHEPLAKAHLEQPGGCLELGSRSSFVGLPVLHLHVLEQFWFGRTRMGFPKTGAVRCRFWLDCVEDLRRSLQARSQHLAVRYGMSAAEAFRELAQVVDFVKVFTYAEVCSEELALEAEVEEVLRQDL